MVKKGSFILYTIDMVNKLSGYRVAWFITLTFGYAAGPDDIEIAIRNGRCIWLDILKAIYNLRSDMKAAKIPTPI